MDRWYEIIAPWADMWRRNHSVTECNEPMTCRVIEERPGTKHCTPLLLLMPNGKTWTVIAQCRGQFVRAPTE